MKIISSSNYCLKNFEVDCVLIYESVFALFNIVFVAFKLSAKDNRFFSFNNFMFDMLSTSI